MVGEDDMAMKMDTHEASPMKRHYVDFSFHLFYERSFTRCLCCVTNTYIEIDDGLYHQELSLSYERTNQCMHRFISVKLSDLNTELACCSRCECLIGFHAFQYINLLILGRLKYFQFEQTHPFQWMKNFDAQNGNHLFPFSVKMHTRSLAKKSIIQHFS